MKKSDKKIENALIKALTQVCEPALDTIPGFSWLTHLVNYAHFPQSLVIVFVFKTEHDLAQARQYKHDEQLIKQAQQQLALINIPLKNTNKQIKFDSEEACTLQHQGNWALRLSA